MAGQSFPLGELTADILNITPEEFDQLYALSGNLGKGKDQEAIMEGIYALLKERLLFQLLTAEGVRWNANKFREIVGDIYSFNQTMFWFIDRFLMHLKKLDPENHAAALYDFYTDPHLDKMMVNFFCDPMHSFSLFDNIEVHFIPMEVPGKPDNYAVYEVYSSETIQGFLKMDFMKAVMAGHVIRRCQNCKRFFLLTQGYKTIYCDQPLADNPRRTCRQQGAKNIAKQKAEGNPVLRSYNKAYQRITADKSRGGSRRRNGGRRNTPSRTSVTWRRRGGSRTGRLRAVWTRTHYMSPCILPERADGRFPSKRGGGGMEEIFTACAAIIESCADKLCFRFECPGLREDLISCGRLAVLEQAADYRPDSRAAVTTYLYPFILGAMRRELEQSLFPMSLSKRGFKKQIVDKGLSFVSLDETFEDDDGNEWSLDPASTTDVEHAVFTKIYLELLRKEFEKCSFRDREILGGLFGVFGCEEQLPVELAFTFQMTESAVLKAKEKALARLRDACLDGELGIWRDVRKMMRAASRGQEVP